MRKIGQKVSWTHLSQGLESIALTLKQGIIIDMGDFIATVYKGKGKVEQVELFRLRTPQGQRQRDEIDEVIKEGLR